MTGQIEKKLETHKKEKNLRKLKEKLKEKAQIFSIFICMIWCAKKYGTTFFTLCEDVVSIQRAVWDFWTL